MLSEIMDPNNRIEKLELMLAEKNKNINILQTELKIFHIQVRESDKLKALLEDEIHRLREQNRIFRSELGPAYCPNDRAIRRKFNTINKQEGFYE